MPNNNNNNNNNKLVCKFDIDINNDELLKTLWKHKKKRCVIHNGLAINLISTIDIYDKLIVVKGFFYNLFWCTSCCCKRKKIMIYFFSFFYITLIMRNPKGISHQMMTCSRNLFKHLKVCYQTKTNRKMFQHDFLFFANLIFFL